eukprot:scaffold131901_cov31-Tisochrysis_lutea.AAC.4
MCSSAEGLCRARGQIPTSHHARQTSAIAKVSKGAREQSACVIGPCKRGDVAVVPDLWTTRMKRMEMDSAA